jgi:hypothetical protein
MQEPNPTQLEYYYRSMLPLNAMLLGDILKRYLSRWFILTTT